RFALFRNSPLPCTTMGCILTVRSCRVMYRVAFAVAVVLCASDVAGARTGQPGVIAHLRAAYETCVSGAVADRIAFALGEPRVSQVVELAFDDCTAEEDALIDALAMVPLTPNQALVEAWVIVEGLKLRIKTDWVTMRQRTHARR